MAGAIRKEEWIKEVQENLFPKFEKIKMGATDDSIYLSNKTVHIPNTSAAGTITKNPSVLPLSVERGTDTEITYDTAFWAMNPQLVMPTDMKQTSYDYMKAKVNDAVKGIPSRIAYDILLSWYADGTYKVNTSGTNFTAHATAATGNRKGLTSNDILMAKKKLKLQNLEDEDIYLYVDEEMYSQLLVDLGITTYRMAAIYDAEKGTLPGLHGVKLITFPQIAYLDSSDGARTYGHAGATSDNAAALMVAKSCVSLAMSEVNVIINDNAPGYAGGTLIEGSMFSGGKYRRYDKKGVVPIIQTT